MKEKMTRDEFVTYLNIAPLLETKDFAVLGWGVTEYGIEYNPTVDSEKYIIHKSASHTHSGNEKQGGVTQTIYKDDPCYQFVKKAKGKLNYVTEILDIDTTEEVDDGEYYAELSSGLVVVNRFLSANADIEYTLYYEGDPIIGKVNMSSGKPVFTPTQTGRMAEQQEVVE